MLRESMFKKKASQNQQTAKSRYWFLCISVLLYFLLVTLGRRANFYPLDNFDDFVPLMTLKKIVETSRTILSLFQQKEQSDSTFTISTRNQQE